MFPRPLTPIVASAEPSSFFLGLQTTGYAALIRRPAGLDLSRAGRPSVAPTHPGSSRSGPDLLTSLHTSPHARSTEGPRLTLCPPEIALSVLGSGGRTDKGTRWGRPCGERAVCSSKGLRAWVCVSQAGFFLARQVYGGRKGEGVLRYPEPPHIPSRNGSVWKPAVRAAHCG